MKITISFLPAESTRALWVLTAVQKVFPKAKVKERTAQPPRKVLYISVKEKTK